MREQGTAWGDFDYAAWKAEQARKLAETKALWAKNRRVIAERLGVPQSVVEQCEALEAEFPAFCFSYWHEDVAWSKKGWYATRWEPSRDECRLFAETAESLRDLVRAIPAEEDPRP